MALSQHACHPITRLPFADMLCCHLQPHRYVVNSPSSVASMSSHASYFQEGSPNLAHAARGTWLQTQHIGYNSPPGSTASGARSARSYSHGLKRGLTPQVLA